MRSAAPILAIVLAAACGDSEPVIKEVDLPERTPYQVGDAWVDEEKMFLDGRFEFADQKIDMTSRKIERERIEVLAVEDGVPTRGKVTFLEHVEHKEMRGAKSEKEEEKEPVHGKTAEVRHDGRSIFKGIENPLVAGRYHSLVVAPALPDELEQLAPGEDASRPGGEVAEDVELGGGQ